MVTISCVVKDTARCAYKIISRVARSDDVQHKRCRPELVIYTNVCIPFQRIPGRYPRVILSF